MQLAHLIKGLDAQLVRGEVDAHVAGVRDDSRRIERGDLFIARSGTREDGVGYVDDALGRGAAAAIACDSPTAARIAERFHGEPSTNLHLVGVTGTNGKTTVAWMIRHLLNAADRKCGLLSTIEIDDGGTEPQAAALTTPGACELSATLARMVEHGCEACVMECSSHALHQGRCEALDFNVAVYTNLSGDHLDYHQTMAGYAASKAKLFTLLRPDGRAVVNGDDPHAPVMIDACAAPVVTYGLGETAEIVAADATGSRVRLVHEGRPLEMTLPLVGRHNVYNLLAAYLAVVVPDGATAVAAAPAAAAAATLPPVPGRLERITPDEAPFQVVVDYAHTDDALQNVLQSLRCLLGTGGRLSVVFGCGGDRDRTKRPRMARVACDLAESVVVTSDNPRSEPPQAIIDQVMTGVPAAARDRVRCHVDRRQAIGQAVGRARPGDIVLIAGKGHENDQIIGPRRYDFDDRVEARRALER
ncbi:MAG: UDP-N-acetylmuramoyl-L-alanyl-D-glutamate--2,6-diaminopimelate ligase [Deinococcus-Thermus bacterium]|jgi:UDP-N-acetylmuramoyl-L-alanyl-D-glutamate--2,6-diaminopimelate ligase|nr:UDP-N-acetylmuramoyl-L-alanyl-D-glutamate--2,6-diaminopimelate ligase [Deinococcota bacterium]